MQSYKTVEYGECEVGISKSKFYGFIVGVDSEEDCLEKLAQYKKKYADATHVCYAYVIDQSTARFSDNGEPHGTAGLPMLEILTHAGLSKVLAVVVRYFGGIKLGTGGLVRAYAGTVKQVLDNAEIITLNMCKVYDIALDYSTHKRLTTFLSETSDMTMLETRYEDCVHITVACGEQSQFIVKLTDKSQGSAVILQVGEQYVKCV